MNKLYSFLILLFCFSSILALGPLNPSTYSLLLESIRKVLVDDALISLPKKQNANYLLMLQKIGEAKRKFQLSGAESAYFEYKWIAQNIRLLGGADDYQQNVYDKGEGSQLGISNLFIQMCNYCQVESKTIKGSIRTMEYSGDVSKSPQIWNYILINRDYYLVDPGWGAETYKLFKPYFDIYFGIKPEIIKNYYFPDDIKWQLLPQPFPWDKFYSLPFSTVTFYALGFTSMSPDYYEIKRSQKIKIILTYEKLAGNISLATFLTNDAFSGYSNPSQFVNCQIVNSNGKIEITFQKPYSMISYLSIILKDNEYGNIPLIMYRLIP